MGIMDKLGDSLGQAAHEMEKALDKGKTKVGELQIEMQMDGLAKKLGYLVFDFYRGRTVDGANDNASGVTAMLGVLHNLVAEPDASRFASSQFAPIRRGPEAAAGAQRPPAGAQQPPAAEPAQSEPDGTPPGPPNP